MVYLFQTNLRANKKTRQALQEIFGVGPHIAHLVCDQLGLSPHHCVKDLTRFQVKQLSKIFSQFFLVGNDLKRLIQGNIKRFVHIGCYKGFRHVQGLPVRGQRTHTNSQTSRRRPGGLQLSSLKKKK